jgi:capsular polysaccharide biosynthesis protein
MEWMELKNLLQIVRERIRILIIIPAAFVLTAALVTVYGIPQLFEANTTIYVISKSNVGMVEYDDIIINQQLVKDYQEFIKSRAVIENVLEEMELTEMTYESLSSSISVKARNDIIDLARIPTRPVSPNVGYNIFLSFIIGLLVALAVIFIVDFLDDTVKTSEDVEKYLNLKVLGIIPVFQQKEQMVEDEEMV